MHIARICEKVTKVRKKVKFPGFAQRVDWRSLELANTLHDLAQLRVS